MSTHKYIDRLCIIVLALTLLLTVTFMNGEKLGLKVITDEDAETYSGSTYFTKMEIGQKMNIQLISPLTAQMEK